MIFSLSARNITRNKRNSFVMIFLIGVITCLFFIGNSVMQRSDRGLRETYVENLTGDIVIEKITDVTMNLFGANTPVIEDYFTIPVLPAYDALLGEVRAVPGVRLVTSQISGQAIVDCNGYRGGALLCGIDPETYFALFPGIVIEEGQRIQSGEYGAMITSARAEWIEKETGVRPAPGDTLVFTTGGTVGFKIREVPLAGIFSYRSSGQFMEQIILLDPQTTRALSSIQVASADVEISEDTALLLDKDMGDIFGEDEGDGADNEDSADSAAPEKGFSIEDLKSLLTDSADGDSHGAAEVQGGDWNFIIIRIDEGAPASRILSDLNSRLLPYGAQAVGWRTAAGVSALLVLLIQSLFNAGIVLVSIAGIITIINLLLISVFRRTREIGTLRAIGASDGYIRTLILWENLLLSLAAGLLGVVAGGLLMYVINEMRIHIANDLLASLFGGRVLTMEFLPGVAATAFIIAVLVGVLASLYPVQKAVKIEPIVAVRRG
ncbi:MAG: FtsX-like permease family protein [Spirochaetales bacterium]|jgi:ABC-type lipoprotein release transport system permease subunit|nr:FtsX-like permease family protein [Spirochaetales bacterium]